MLRSKGLEASIGMFFSRGFFARSIFSYMDIALALAMLDRGWAKINSTYIHIPGARSTHFEVSGARDALRNICECYFIL